MGRKRLKKVKRTKTLKQESNYNWCVRGKRKCWMHKRICEERCDDSSCPVYRKIAGKKRKEELERKKKEFEKEGISRSMLLRPEDREPSKKTKKKGKVV